MAPLVRGLTGSAHGDVPPAPRSSGHETEARTGDAEAGEGTAEQSMSTSITSAAEDELPEPGTTRNLLAKFQSLQTTTQ